MSAESQERLADLLVDRSLFGLNEQEQSELFDLAGIRYEDELAAYDQALAAVQEALVASREEAPPAALESKLLADASAFFAAQSAQSAPAQPAAPEQPAPVHSFAAAQERQAASRTPWLVTAAALLLAVTAWWPSSLGESSPETAYQALLASAPQDLLQLDWQVFEDPNTESGSTSGRIVWSDSEQQGYMRFEGLAANDAKSEQYQLWIFDREQDDAHPIDGGVFDIPAGATEVVIPIDAKIQVSQAWMFAITVEKPGGVVVSDRSRLPLLATTAS
jgi:anti-sigma-K factor RskA